MHKSAFHSILPAPCIELSQGWRLQHKIHSYKNTLEDRKVQQEKGKKIFKEEKAEKV